MEVSIIEMRQSVHLARSLIRPCLLAALGLVFSLASAQDYLPVSCDKPLPYEGPAAYGGPVLLPTEKFSVAGELDPATSGRLGQGHADAMHHAKATAMSAAVWTKEGRWSATKIADGTDTGLKLYWASVGKAVTAALVMKLVQEGRLSLEQPVSTWFAAFPNSAVMTLDDLLRHTAGVFSANEDRVVIREPRYRSPEESVAIAARHGPMFCPGQRWRYSNTGYAMLGRIIEAVEGQPYHQVVRARISAPLGLHSFRALEPLEENPPDVARLSPADPSQPMMVPSWGGAAGNIVASAADMVTFWHALLTSRILNADNTARLFEPLLPMFDTDRKSVV